MFNKVVKNKLTRTQATRLDYDLEARADLLELNGKLGKADKLDRARDNLRVLHSAHFSN